MAYRMTPARRAALRRAQLASAAKRRGRRTARSAKRGYRKTRGVAKAQRTYSRRRRVAKGRQFRNNFSNEMRFYKGGAIRTASILTGAKPKSRKNQVVSRRGVTKRFVGGVVKNQRQYNKSIRYARRVRNNQVKRAMGFM